MALSIAEELLILKDTDGTNGPDAPDTLEDIVYQTAVGHSVTLLTTHKVFTPAGNEKADSYLTKVLGVATRIGRKDVQTIDTMRKVLVSLIGDNPGINIGTVQGATNEQWATFVQAEIEQMFELTGGVRVDEKSAYDALP